MHVLENCSYCSRFSIMKAPVSFFLSQCYRLQHERLGARGTVESLHAAQERSCSLVSEAPDPIFACSLRISEVDDLCFLLQLSHIGNTPRMWICIIDLCRRYFDGFLSLWLTKLSVQNACNIINYMHISSYIKECKYKLVYRLKTDCIPLLYLMKDVCDID